MALKLHPSYVTDIQSLGLDGNSLSDLWIKSDVQMYSDSECLLVIDNPCSMEVINIADIRFKERPTITIIDKDGNELYVDQAMAIDETFGVSTQSNDDRYLLKTGGDINGGVSMLKSPVGFTFPNGKWNNIGDDTRFGDINVANTFGVQSTSNNAIGYVRFGNTTSGATIGTDGTNFTISGPTSAQEISATAITEGGIALSNKYVNQAVQYTNPTWLAGIDASTIKTGTIDLARLPAMPSANTIVCTTIPAMTSGDQLLVAKGTVVIESTTGNTYRYSGTGSVTLNSSYIQQSDLTPDWAVITNRPTNVSTWTNDSGYLTNTTGDSRYYTKTQADAKWLPRGGGYMNGPITMGAGATTSASTLSTTKGFLFDVYAGIVHFNSATKNGVGGTLGPADGPFIYGYGGVALGYTNVNSADGLVAALKTQGTNVTIAGTLSVSGAITEAGTALSSKYVSISGSYSDPSWITSLSASKITQSASYRFTTDAEKATWNGKQNAITLGTTAQYFDGTLALKTFPTTWAWASLTGVPSTFTPSTHTHAIADTTGLQAALDAKLSIASASSTYQPIGSYSLSTHNHNTDYVKLSGGFLNNSAQLGLRKDITVSASANTNYALAPLTVERLATTGTATNAGIGFSNTGVNAAFLYYDSADGAFKFNRHTGDIATFWTTWNLTGDQTLHYHSSDRAWGNITGKPFNFRDYTGSSSYEGFYPTGVTPTNANFAVLWSKDNTDVYLNAANTIYLQTIGSDGNRQNRMTISDTSVDVSLPLTASTLTASYVRSNGHIYATGNLNIDGVTTLGATNMSSAAVLTGTWNTFTNTPYYNAGLVISAGVLNAGSSDVLGNKFVKTGGTSSQFLMADGSIFTKPNTLAGYGITDAASSSHVHTSINASASNETTIANGYASTGTLYVNYRGATSAITEYNFWNGMNSSGALASVKASKFIATETGSNLIDLTLGKGASTGNYTLLTFNTERPWKFGKAGDGASTSLNLFEQSGQKTFYIGYSSDGLTTTSRSLQITTHATEGSGALYSWGGWIHTGWFSASGTISEGGTLLSAKYQPLENQRLSTTNSATFARLTVSGQIAATDTVNGILFGGQGRIWRDSGLQINDPTVISLRIAGGERLGINSTSLYSSYRISAPEFKTSWGINGAYNFYGQTGGNTASWSTTTGIGVSTTDMWVCGSNAVNIEAGGVTNLIVAQSSGVSFGRTALVSAGLRFPTTSLVSGNATLIAGINILGSGYTYTFPTAVDGLVCFFSCTGSFYIKNTGGAMYINNGQIANENVTAVKTAGQYVAWCVGTTWFISGW